jgi:hypothetical protein
MNGGDGRCRTLWSRYVLAIGPDLKSRMCVRSGLGLRGNQFDTALRTFHRFSIDVQPGWSYSERINSKDLVTIANSKLRLPHLKCVVSTTLHPVPHFPTTNLNMVAVSTADLGGYFSA